MYWTLWNNRGCSGNRLL